MKILKFIINVLIIFPLINIFSLKGAALAIMICELIGPILIIGKYNVSKRILQSK